MATLDGIANEGTLRLFTFKLAVDGQPEMLVVVFADLVLAKKYNIPFQELPLLCLRFVENRSAGASGTLAFSEDEMIDYDQRRNLVKDVAKQKRRLYPPASVHPQPKGV